MDAYIHLQKIIDIILQAAKISEKTSQVSLFINIKTYFVFLL